MGPFSPFCGTVLKAQLLTLPATISPSAPGVVTTQLPQAPPASSSATDVAASSDSRPATAQPPEPAPTTTKSNVSVTDVSPCNFLFVIASEAKQSRLSIPHPQEPATPASKDEAPPRALPLRDPLPPRP